ncbi:MAG: DUF1080 domain-containing protein [Planctomycetes bacterium]|nr:DUF1080 domain-containing protein [Planctomycetota bacterium]
MLLASLALLAPLASCAAPLAAPLAAPQAAPEFRPLFDGKTLDGWQLVGGDGRGYVIEDGCIVCPKDGGGNLFTTRDFGDFILRFEFSTEPGGNNGVGIRAPLQGDAAYVGMEVQILDDAAPQYANLKPGQYCGSVYMVSPVKRGALKSAGEWNAMEITARGRTVQVKLNGALVNDVDLNTVHDAATLAAHPGILRERGHVGFLGHQSLVKYRKIELAELPPATPPAGLDNVAPAGMRALFDGKTLSNWKGLVSPDKGPPGRAAMGAAQLAAAQATADEKMRAHWSVQDGTLVFDGGGDSLCTAEEFEDFELWVDWKIAKAGDSGIYLRGSPQVQIWDNPIGSGGLYNNQQPGNPSGPLAVADRPVGEWNRFKILMVGEKVTVFLNDVLVVNATTLENYWQRELPIYPRGQIELQNHGNTLWFRNVFVRELPRAQR